MRRTTLVSLGLFAAWAVHDTEELLTAVDASREQAARMPSWLPVPQDIREHGFTQEHFRTGLVLMAGLIASAAADGVRSEGRGWWFQTVLAGFGLHGIGHLVGSAAMRRYTYGVATAPVVVIPYWLWARHELRRSGVRLRRVEAPAAALIPAVILGTHAATRLLLRARR